MEYDEQVEARLTILEARLAFSEQRLSALERRDWSAIDKPEKKVKARRELTPEEKKALRARLVAGQEKARARREAEAKTQTKKDE